MNAGRNETDSWPIPGAPSGSARSSLSGPSSTRPELAATWGKPGASISTAQLSTWKKPNTMSTAIWAKVARSS